MRKPAKYLRQIISIIIVITFLLSSLTACTAKSEGHLTSNGNLKTDVADTPDTIIDCAGRTVKVPKKVERIACLYAFSGHVVTMLGKGNEIVAVVSGLKRDLILKELVPSISQASVPVNSGAINIEELIKAQPDIAFVQSSSVSNMGELEKLENSKIPFVVVDYTSMKEQQYAIEIIGKAIGEEKRANEYNDYYENWVQYVGKQVAGIPESSKLKVYHSVNEATRTDKKNTLPADWIEVAGLKNVSVEEDLKLIDNAYYASLEQIYLWNPDAIIANEAGVADYILKNNQWKSLRAVKEKKVYQMPNGISRWGHPGSLETPLGLIWTVKTLYPEYFKEINLATETKKYYKQFFNIDLTDETVQQILSGKGMRLLKGEEK